MLAAACRLFYREGLRAVGVDRIVAESGVAKMSLYNHFGSKDELIVAYVADAREGWERWLEREVEAPGGEPRERLLLVFDVLAAWFRQPDYRGCPLVNAALELADAGHAAHAMCAEHRRELHAYLARLADEAGLARPDELAGELQLIVEGAIVTALVQDATQAGERARAAAVTLIEAAVPRSGNL